MPFTDAQRATAVSLVLNHWQVRFCVGLKRDPERVGKLADAVWKYCESYPEFAKAYAIDRDTALTGVYHSITRSDPAGELTNFIPFWAFALILKVIIAILVEFWLMNRTPS